MQEQVHLSLCIFLLIIFGCLVVDVTPLIRNHAQNTAIVTRGNAASTSSSSATPENADPSVERFYFEHMIGEKDAARAFAGMADVLINKIQPAWCPACNKSIVRYCLDSRMLHDHCCCDSGHARDQLPWLPHSCYVGDNCQPNLKSCMTYTEIRECCCDRIMAKQWREIHSGAAAGQLAHSWSSAVGAMLLTVAISQRRPW